MILYKSRPFCLTTFLSSLALFLSLSSLSLHRIRACISPRVVFFLPRLLSSLRIDPRFSARSLLVPYSSLLLREARDRHLHRWQGDSFVLSRRFQLIFIVYLPDRRYREDNGPPLYKRALANLSIEAYSLSSCVSVRCGWLFSSVSAFDLSETDCVNRHC